MCLFKMCDASLSESPEEEDDIETPEKGNGAPSNDDHETTTPPLDDFLGSPRKRTQTLPTFNCPLTGMAAKADALNRWSRIQETPEEKSGTLSEDIFKILDLRSSGSLFGGSLMGTKKMEDKSMARRGSDTTTSAAAAPTKPERADSQPVSVLTHQKSEETLPVRSLDQQVNSKPEEKKEGQQLIER